MNSNNYIVIMAGGVGSRFWPMSRTDYPKQFLDVLQTGKTLLQSTYDRFSGLVPAGHVFVITSDAYTDLVQRQLPGLPAENIIGEPERKNTAACIACMAFKLAQLNPDANMIVTPSDHLIANELLLETCCREALAFTADTNAFVTIGIRPTHANTGYGYIKFDPVPASTGIYPVQWFAEKPQASIAAEYLASGDYLWNAGIFIWKATAVQEAFRQWMPVIYEAFHNRAGDLNTDAEAEAIVAAYADCPAISIDYAILEKANNVFVMPAHLGWSDLGTWNSAWENFERDSDGNAIAGNNAVLVDANGCMVHSTDQKLLLIGGVDNLIVVNTPDVILVCRRENEQEIKHYVAQLERTKGYQYL